MTAIYNKYHEYFNVVDENKDLYIMYVIAKEPSDELVAEIEEYNAKIKELGRKKFEFVDRIARVVLEELSEDDKRYIYDYPDSAEYHFGMAMGIRNRFIYGQEVDIDRYEPDDLSGEIMSRIASLLIENYDYDDSYYYLVYESGSFNHARRLYHIITGDCPDAIIDKYADMPDDVAAAQMAEAELNRIVLDEDGWI